MDLVGSIPTLEVPRMLKGGSGGVLEKLAFFFDREAEVLPLRFGDYLRLIKGDE